MMFVDCLLKPVTLSMSVKVVLFSKQMLRFCCVGGFLLDSFAMVPTGCVNFCGDQFYQNAISRYWFCVHVFVKNYELSLICFVCRFS